VAIANDITYQSGAFGPREDCLFRAATELALEEKLPCIYLAANRFGSTSPPLTSKLPWPPQPGAAVCGGDRFTAIPCVVSQAKTPGTAGCFSLIIPTPLLGCPTTHRPTAPTVNTTHRPVDTHPHPSHPPVVRAWVWPLRSGTTSGWPGPTTTPPLRASGGQRAQPQGLTIVSEFADLHITSSQAAPQGTLYQCVFN
jgi:hypothetical protein